MDLEGDQSRDRLDCNDFFFFVSPVSFCLGKLSNENILAAPYSLEPQTVCNF